MGKAVNYFMYVLYGITKFAAVISFFFTAQLYIAHRLQKRIAGLIYEDCTSALHELLNELHWLALTYGIKHNKAAIM